MEKLLNSALLPYLNATRPGNVNSYDSVVAVQTEDVVGKPLCLAMLRQRGEARGISDSQKERQSNLRYSNTVGLMHDCG